LLTVSINTVFSASWWITNFPLDNGKTIKELKENIDVLNRDKKGLNLEFSILNKDLKLKSFFRENLAASELEDIKYIINNYLVSKNKLEKSLTRKAALLEDTREEKKWLLTKKKEFYQSLVPFIKRDKLKEYLEYISVDAKILKEQKEVDTQIIVKKEIISNKVERIEEKIIKHRRLLDEKFRRLIEVKVNKKIDNLKNNEKFGALSLELKEVVLDNVIKKIQVKIDVLESRFDKTDALTRKLEVYKIVLIKLEDFKFGLSIIEEGEE
jgi:hypothetical protein